MFKSKFIFFCILNLALQSHAQLVFEGGVVSLDSLNTTANESHLMTTTDDQKIYFTRSFYPLNTGGIDNPGDIYLTKKNKDWQRPIRLSNSDSDAIEIPVGMLSDDLVFAKIVEKFNQYTTRIYRQDPNGTSPIIIPYFKNHGSHLSGYISSDERFLLLSMESTTTYGVEDIYVCKRKNDVNWSSPKNLGSMINTAFQEFTPFLTTDGQTLYWSTNGREGLGSFDIYSSQRLDDSWQKWTEPTNIGPVINSEGAETSFQLSGGYAYFISSRDSEGYGDLKRIKLMRSPDNNEGDSSLNNITSLRFFEFHIFDHQSHEPLPAVIEMESNLFDTTYEAAQKVFLPFSKISDYKITVQVTGYFPREVLFTETELSESPVNKIDMKRIEVGVTMQLNKVLFEKGSTRLIEGSELELDELVKILSENPKINIMITGHTDGIGSPSKNLKLSQLRAERVRMYVLKKGIANTRVQYKGYGGTRPIASNESEETRRLNRRVEFTILEN